MKKFYWAAIIILPVLLIASQSSKLSAWGPVEQPKKVFGFQYTVGKKGVVIIAIIANSPAHKAGLEAGDVILKLNGKEINVKTFSKSDNPMVDNESVEFFIQKSGGQKITVTVDKQYPSQFIDRSGPRYAGMLKMGGYVKGDKVSNLEITDLQTGGKTDLYALNSKVKLVTFWASWCGACKSEIPVLKRIKNYYSKNELTMIGVSFDSTRNAMSDFAEYKNMNWYHVWAGANPDTPIHHDWDVYLLPTNVILNSKNEVLEILDDDSLLEERLEYYIESR